MYKVLLDAFGPQNWWPAKTAFEVCVGAVLTQNTNWKNVERAIMNLRRNRLLTPSAIRGVRQDRLARAIRSSGYYNQKAKRLKIFARWFDCSLGNRFKNAKGIPTSRLRDKLLAIPGIGPETADSILLYAFGRPTFVVDAYTRRLVERHNMLPEDASYDEIKLLFESSLKKSPKIYNEFHALIVRLGKTHCKKTADCEKCPLLLCSS